MARDVNQEVAHLNAIGRLVGLGAAAEEVLHAQHQFARTERLGDVIVGAELEAEHAVQFRRLGGQHDDGDCGGGRVTAQDFADLEPVHLGQHEVEEDQVRGEGAGLLQGLVAVARRDHVKTGATEIEFHQFDGIRFVVHHQDFRFHPGFGYHARMMKQQRPSYKRVTFWVVS